MKIIIFLCFTQILFAFTQKVEYVFYDDPIDVVIPAIKKDLETLDDCIESIKKNVHNVRRVIVVSPERLTDKAEWFDEKNYPFSLYDIGYYIFNKFDWSRNPFPSHGGLTLYNGCELAAKAFVDHCTFNGWILQQLLKLYAPFVIPDISSNVLVVDADVIFFRPVTFLGESGEGLYTAGGIHSISYFDHMWRLLPIFIYSDSQYSAVTHHMLFQRSVLEDLFGQLQTHYKMLPWQAICSCIDPLCIELGCLSEYEIYFHFVFTRSNQVKLRPLNWVDRGEYNAQIREKDLAEGFDFAAYHTCLR